MIFLDAPLNSLGRLDTPLGSKIMSPAFIEQIVAYLGRNDTGLRDCVITWLCDHVILQFL